LRDRERIRERLNGLDDLAALEAFAVRLEVIICVGVPLEFLLSERDRLEHRVVLLEQWAAEFALRVG